MRNTSFLFLLIILPLLLNSSCKDDEDEIILDAETATLVESLNEELHPLSENPNTWSNDELHFLDPIADKTIIGLGEATHGTAEFFNAKHRIFKYLVENHGYKIFAFEADFGESILINEAVQAGSKSRIKHLMKNMHFWTWKTKEVERLLEWMCDYNVGKPAEEKVHYVGVDCQYNTFHPGMVREYLMAVNAPFLNMAEDILQEA